MTTNDIDAKQTVVDDFNAEHFPGAWVRYWTGTRDDAPKYGQTRSKAELLSGHTPVVWVTGHGACIALTHVDVIPGQPDGIEFDSGDLPDPVRAIDRVREYIGAFGDGIYNVVDGHPLYARDVEALRQAALKVAEVEALTVKLEDRRVRLRDAENDLLNVRGILSPNGYPQRVPVDLVPTVAPAVKWLADRVDTLTAENARARENVAELENLLDKTRAALDHANRDLAGTRADRDSAVQANTAWANQTGEQQPQVWAAPAEPTDVTAVRDRNGQLWVCPGRPGNNLWWRDVCGRGVGYEWHQLLQVGPLTPADAEATR